MMNKKKSIIQQDDHIILPKATLRRFADNKTKKICCLKLSDSNNLAITKHYPKSFHTKPNYYNPEFDNIVKRYETLIGKWHKEIMNAIKTNTIESLITNRLEELKKDIIELITIQFHRTVLADEKLLAQYIEQEKKRYEEFSANFFRSGRIPEGFLNNKQRFFNKEIDQVQYYSQNILGQPNEGIEKTYKDSIPYIFYIPNEIDSTFLLPPQHFVPNNAFARFILSPRLALALYKDNSPQRTIILKKEDVDCLVPRAIESALSISKEYQEIIGEEKYLHYIKSKIEKYMSMIKEIAEEQIILISGDEEILQDDQTILEMIVSIMYFKPESKKIIIETGVLSSKLLKLDETTKNEGLYMFAKWGYKIVLINQHDLSNSNSGIAIAKTKEDAIKLLS